MTRKNEALVAAALQLAISIDAQDHTDKDKTVITFTRKGLGDYLRFMRAIDAYSTVEDLSASWQEHKPQSIAKQFTTPYRITVSSEDLSQIIESLVRAYSAEKGLFPEGFSPESTRTFPRWKGHLKITSPQGIDAHLGFPTDNDITSVTSKALRRRLARLAWITWAHVRRVEAEEKPLDLATARLIAAREEIKDIKDRLIRSGIDTNQAIDLLDDLVTEGPLSLEAITGLMDEQ